MVKKVFFLVPFLPLILLSSDDVLILYKSGKTKAYENNLIFTPTQTIVTPIVTPVITPNRGPSIVYNLSGKDLRFGYFENPVSLLTCNKQKGVLELYSTNTNKQFFLKNRFKAFTGKNAGDKMKEGDLKTPIGVYTLTQKKTNVDPFYGPMAFVTSYPNIYDRVRGKSGDGIWIHGVPINGSRDAFTKGCIAIQNNDLIQLDQKISPSKTLLIINSGNIKSASSNTYGSILNALNQWKSAWERNDINTYLSYYDSMFKRFDGMNLKQFMNYKERIFSKNEAKRIELSDISIIPYPEKENLFYILFSEKYESPTYKFNGEKSLLVSLKNDNTITILVEE